MLYQLIELVSKEEYFSLGQKEVNSLEISHKLAQLFTNSRIYRRCIAIDETKIKIGDKLFGFGTSKNKKQKILI